MKINQYKSEKDSYGKKIPQSPEKQPEIKDVVSLSNHRDKESFPLSLPSQPEQIYTQMEKKVAAAELEYPIELEKLWEEVSKDGNISISDKKKLDKAMGDKKIGNLTLKDGTDSIEANYIKAWMDMDKAGQVKMDPEVKLSYNGELQKREAQLMKGKVLTGHFINDDGMMHELTEGLVSIPYDKFIEKLKPDEWGINLVDQRGGQVRVSEYDEQNRPVKQMERMVNDSPLSKYMGIFKPLDMTKVETIKWDKDKSKISWEVLKSDNNTVLADVGSLTFASFGENQTKITFHSAHKLNNFPSNLNLTSTPSFEKLRNRMVLNSLSDYFVATIKHYRELFK